MQAKKKIILVLPVLLLMLLISGCLKSQRRVDVIASRGTINEQQNRTVATRFQEPNPQGQSAVESAIELSQKYSRLSEETAALRIQNQELINEKARLEKDTRELETKLKQAQKELTEANDLLIEMRIELNNWKTDVIGFRGEMREAETAQLEALLKILKILGGETPVESVRNVDEGPVLASSELAQSESRQVSNKDVTNE